MRIKEFAVLLETVATYAVVSNDLRIGETCKVDQRVNRKSPSTAKPTEQGTSGSRDRIRSVTLLVAMKQKKTNSGFVLMIVAVR